MDFKVGWNGQVALFTVHVLITIMDLLTTGTYLGVNNFIISMLQVHPMVYYHQEGISHSETQCHIKGLQNPME